MGLRAGRTWALHLGGAHSDSLWLTFAAPPQGRVRLSGVQTSALFDDPGSWPRALDDRPARADWGWQPHFTLEQMAADLVPQLLAAARHRQAG